MGVSRHAPRVASLLDRAPIEHEARNPHPHPHPHPHPNPDPDPNPNPNPNPTLALTLTLILTLTLALTPTLTLPLTLTLTLTLTRRAPRRRRRERRGRPRRPRPWCEVHLCDAGRAMRCRWSAAPPRRAAALRGPACPGYTGLGAGACSRRSPPCKPLPLGQRRQGSCAHGAARPRGLPRVPYGECHTLTCYLLTYSYFTTG